MCTRGNGRGGCATVDRVSAALDAAPSTTAVAEALSEAVDAHAHETRKHQRRSTTTIIAAVLIAVIASWRALEAKVEHTATEVQLLTTERKEHRDDHRDIDRGLADIQIKQAVQAEATKDLDDKLDLIQKTIDR